MDEREQLPSGPAPDPDPDWDAYLAWRDREIAAGREEEPPAEWEIERPAVSLSFGDAADVDPALLMAMCGPDGLDSDALGPQFSQDSAADTLRPGPLLAALTEPVSDDLSRLTDNQLMGAIHAAQRLQNRYSYVQMLAIAEFGRRRLEEFDAARARGVRVRCRAGEFPGVELASELLISRVAAGQLIDNAAGLTDRLPLTLQGMSDGLIDAERAAIIASYTGCLSPEDAAKADEILAPLAPEVRAETLARRAAALEMKLDPEAAKTRKESARRVAQRVDVRLERSGNASVAGRELDVADALASKANIHSIALRLRRAGLEDGIDRVRAGVFNDLLQSRNPFDRLAPVPEAPADEVPPDDARLPDDQTLNDRTSGTEPTPESGQRSADGHDPAGDHFPTNDHGTSGAPLPESPGDDWDPVDDWEPVDDLTQWEPADDAADEYPDRAHGDLALRNSDYVNSPTAGDELDRTGTWSDPAESPAAASRAPMPAVINLLVHAGTLFGWDTEPSRASGWGLLNPAETTDIVRLASQHPQTRWCMTVIGRDGTAVAHGCSPGQHPWSPQTPHPSSQQAPPSQGAPPSPGRTDGPSASQVAQFAELLRSLKFALEPIARGTCDHRHAEGNYTPSRKLQHLVRARTATCTAPGCQAEAIHADLDHTVPHPDGATDECNLGPKCRTHHRAKQTPGWKVEQPEPGVFRWTLPCGRTHTTRPTTY